MTAEQLEKFLDDLATKLTPPGQHIFELAVRNQIITATMWTITGLVFIFLSLLIFTICLVWLCKSKEPEKPEYTGPPERYDRTPEVRKAELDYDIAKIKYEKNLSNYNEDVTIAFIVMVVCFFTFFIGLSLLFLNIPTLLNPEWYALKDILSQIPKPQVLRCHTILS